MNKFLLCVSACAILGACATDPASSAESGEDKEYRTGSNIPARTRAGVTAVSPDEIERQRNATTGTMLKRGN
ncbi:MAG: hypothetical protein M3R58_16135 [Pseudomonadota bacterium]|nr:hypothetical protein [Pseudomonadota bacterium]